MTTAHRRRRLTSALAVVATLMSLAACSATTRQSANNATIGVNTPGGGQPTTGVSAGAPSVSGKPAAAPIAAQGSAAAAGAPTAVSLPGAGAPAGSVKSRICPTGKPLEIGISYQADLAAGQALVGSPNDPYGSQSGDQIQASYRQMFDKINSIGGFAGCKIVPVFFAWYVTRSDTQTQSQQECAAWSQDHHVAFALPSTFENFTAAECLAKAGTPMLWGSLQQPLVDNQILNRYGGKMYQLGISADRMAPLIDQFQAAGYFDHGAKVGVIMRDSGDGVAPHLWQDVWKPRLAALHVNVVAEYTMTYNPGGSIASGLADLSRQSQAAVLQFRQHGADHVLAVPGAGMISFVPEASSQGYHPRYGYTTLDQPVTMENFGKTSDLANSVVVGWSPIGDGVPEDQWTTNATSKLCKKLGAGSGVNAGPCEILLLLRAAYGEAPGPSVPGLQAGFAALGTSFASDSLLGPTRFQRGRYDGAAAIRVAKFDSGKQSYVYTSGIIPLP